MKQNSNHINQMYSLLAQARIAHGNNLANLDEATSNHIDTLLSRADDLLHQAGVHHGRGDSRAAHSALTSAASHIGTVGRLLNAGSVRPLADSIASGYRRANLG